MANCLYLHDSYITKFDFVNYTFAKLVVAWLYVNLALIVYALNARGLMEQSVASPIADPGVASSI